MGAADARGAAAGGPLFSCEYDYGNDLLMDFAMQQAGPERKRALLVAGSVGIALGAGLLIIPSPLRVLGLVPLFFGITCLWQRAHLFQSISRQLIAEMDEDAEKTGGRHRVVVADEGGLTITTPDGTARRFEATALTGVQKTKRMWILVFGRDGVVLPYESFTQGSPEALGALLETWRG